MSIREGYRIRLGSFKKQQQQQQQQQQVAQAQEELRSSSPRVLEPLCSASSHMASRSGSPKKRNETLRLIVITFCGVALGFFIGIFFTRFGLTYRLGNDFLRAQDIQLNDPAASSPSRHPRGTEGLPLGIIVPETDLYQRRLWGNPSEDLPSSPSKYLVTFTVGIKQKEIVNKAVAKFPKEWTILLFHYDGVTDDWDDLEWSKTAIHISAKKQTKWWYAKRFLHPDVVAPYDYIFIWDEDLDVENFDGEKYIHLVRKYGLEISQPALEPDKGLTWQMTKRRGDVEVHKTTEERPGWCTNPLLPPCAGFVEIMAPVFSKKAWRCVWHMIQNDLVHGWGLDFSMRRCVEPAHEKIGVVDSQYIKHQVVPSLGQQGEASDGKQPWEGVRERCRFEWKIFSDRIEAAEAHGAVSSLPTEPL
ncbi:hypothetical protein MPTK1_6g12910 [Marchantia polymorpha subsp. ruderalis]|uniref:Uncharacterized protein n=4 Tax=Marchantia polymorpha TaxID=3197 RepID=A0AAF6BRG5_MARPO|nr:hypothetical protein MARPO_0059s0057 [Marchantia polymorpha]BBN14599.1 hypothetical protein Mp_6g12910 [Marchantia polymorpha subsp. ruderalis]|eukprot:PTQ37121.1 hypothetical protein MARPO_0059s0057 [Marchantia polymorpha]